VQPDGGTHQEGSDLGNKSRDVRGVALTHGATRRWSGLAAGVLAMILAGSAIAVIAGSGPKEPDVSASFGLPSDELMSPSNAIGLSVRREQFGTFQRLCVVSRAPGWPLETLSGGACTGTRPVDENGLLLPNGTSLDDGTLLADGPRSAAYIASDGLAYYVLETSPDANGHRSDCAQANLTTWMQPDTDVVFGTWDPTVCGDVVTFIFDDVSGARQHPLTATATSAQS